jgi:hypothetical protein
MQLPNRERAFIARQKLTDESLSESHPVGRSKAKFFRSLGFDASQVDLLEQGLLAIARSQEVEEMETTAHGIKYVIQGALATPLGNQVRLQTVWIIDQGEENPRFVTAYPA